MRVLEREDTRDNFTKTVDAIDRFIDDRSRVLKKVFAVGVAVLASATFVDFVSVSPHYSQEATTHVVESGETMSEIARDISDQCPNPDLIDAAYNQTLNQIAKLNQIPRDQIGDIDVNQSLVVPTGNCKADSPFDVFGAL